MKKILIIALILLGCDTTEPEQEPLTYEIIESVDDFGFTWSSDDGVAAVSGDVGNNAFMNQWIGDNTPTTGNGMDDITNYSTAIPEFSTLLMPIASVILIVGYNHRLKRKYSQQH